MNITIYTSDHCFSCREVIRFSQEGRNLRQEDDDNEQSDVGRAISRPNRS
jgi:hypothetical protein